MRFFSAHSDSDCSKNEQSTKVVRTPAVSAYQRSSMGVRGTLLEILRPITKCQKLGERWKICFWRLAQQEALVY